MKNFTDPIEAILGGEIGAGGPENEKSRDGIEVSAESGKTSKSGPDTGRQTNVSHETPAGAPEESIYDRVISYTNEKHVQKRESRLSDNSRCITFRMPDVWVEYIRERAWEEKVTQGNFIVGLLVKDFKENKLK